MGVNVYKPHVIVLVEDSANREIANGFLLDSSLSANRIQVLNPSGGWQKVHKDFLETEIDGLQKYKGRHLVMIVDFDDKFKDRIHYFKQHIPSELQDRVYLLGTSVEPETLKKLCGDSFEEIGKRLAAECFHDTAVLWNHPHLAHNEGERERLRNNVRSFLFSNR